MDHPSDVGSGSPTPPPSKRADTQDSPKAQRGKKIFRVSAIILPILAISFLLLRWADGRRGTLEVSVEEYVGVQRNGKVSSAVLRQSDLVATMRMGYVKDGRMYRKISCQVPAQYLSDDDLSKSLYDGLPPGGFTYVAESSLMARLLNFLFP